MMVSPLSVTAREAAAHTHFFPLEFGVYVDKHGDPSRGAQTIEWEGTAERAALHSPYILLFDTRFIEIRHVESGKLVQIIPGQDVRCIWEGRAANPRQSQAGGYDGYDDMIQEAQVHCVMNGTDPGQRVMSRSTPQHVFELIPTVPLYPTLGDGQQISPGDIGQPHPHATGYQPNSHGHSHSHSVAYSTTLSYSPPSNGRDSTVWR
jgi:hypothetical protein